MTTENAQTVYDRLWDAARATFSVGHVRTDPHLLNRAADDRRGLTLIIRPGPVVLERITALIDELRALAPDQYFYRPDEIHITLLAVISSAPGFDLDGAPLDAFRAAFADVFARTRPFPVHLVGISASPDSVLITGQSDALNAVRDAVRQALAAAGLDDRAEQRYRSVTAHSTVLRFRSQPANLPALAHFLDSARLRDLGAWDVDCIEFVFNDWYMSHDVVRVLASYPLRKDERHGL